MARFASITLDDVPGDRTALDRFADIETPRAGLLARASVDITGLMHSVDSQKGVGETAADRMGWDLPPERIWIDNAVSASKYSRVENRKTFEAAMEAITTCSIDVLIMTELSRATRKNREWVALFDACAENDVLVYVNGQLYDLNIVEHATALGLNAVVAVGESSRTHARVMRGRKSAVMAGRPMSRPAYGYIRVYNDRGGLVSIELHPEQAPIVKEIFERWNKKGESKESSLWGIASDLNRRGVPSPGGTVWLPHSVRQLLQNPRYNHQYVWRGAIVEGVVPMWPRMVPPEQWERAQARFETREKRRGHRRTAKWVLSGIAECGVCGGRIRRGGRRETPTYVCRGEGAGGVAGCTSIRVAVADEIIKYQVVARLSDPRIADGLLESSDEMAAAFEAQERIQALERELEGLERQVEEGELSVRLAGAEERRLIREIEQLRPKTLVRFPGDKAQKLAG